MSAPKIVVAKNGPLLVSGSVPLEKADGTKLAVKETVALCRCGHSKNKPFCDGSHAKENFKDEQ